METFLQALAEALVPVVVTIIVGYVAMLYKKVTGRQLEAFHRDAFQTALTNVAGGILATYGTSGAVSEKAIDVAVARLRKSVPDALEAFGLDGVNSTAILKNKVIEKVGLLTAKPK